MNVRSKKSKEAVASGARVGREREREEGAVELR